MAKRRRCWRHVATLLVVCCVSLLLSPVAGAIDWSKCPTKEARPADAPRGWSHWWGAKEYFKENNCDAAISTAQYMIDHPEFSTPKYSRMALVLQGQCYERQEKPAKAMLVYIQALKRYGKDERAFFLLADLYRRQGNPAKAAKLYAATLSMNPKNSDAARGLAASYLAMGKTEKAREATERAEKLGADVAALRRKLAKGGAEQKAPEQP